MKWINESMHRREFARHLSRAGAAAGLALGNLPSLGSETTPQRLEYRGPNIVLIRFGGGARRRESIDTRHTHTPFTCHELVKQGVLYPRMEIDQLLDLNTSHGEGTLNLITGRYEKYRDVGESRPETGHRLLGARFEAKVPTLFEQLRAGFDVPDHQALIVNSEDRGDEEFYNFSNHHLFGVRYKSQTLSLRRFKSWLLRDQLKQGKWEGVAREKKSRELAKMESVDYRVSKEEGQGKTLDRFWSGWRDFYGESGLVNPRGDRLLTQLALRALKELRPKLLMVNYQDCDYVHWGFESHYTRALSIMDNGIQQLFQAIQSDPEYRENTILALVPDCGRDDNPFIDVPCQHHFNSRAAHEIFALFIGPGIPRGKVVDKVVQQISVAPTLAQFMRIRSTHAEGTVLSETFA